MSEPTLGCFITSHGFGHASRSLAVLSELQALVPTLRFEIFTQTPYWFLAENLDPACFTHHDVNVDVGLVQKNPFQHDKIVKDTAHQISKEYNVNYDDVVKTVKLLSGVEL